MNTLDFQAISLYIYALTNELGIQLHQPSMTDEDPLPYWYWVRRVKGSNHNIKFRLYLNEDQSFKLIGIQNEKVVCEKRVQTLTDWLRTESSLVQFLGDNDDNT